MKHEKVTRCLDPLSAADCSSPETVDQPSQRDHVAQRQLAHGAKHQRNHLDNWERKRIHVWPALQDTILFRSSTGAGLRAALGGWPTFTLFVKVGTTRSAATVFLSRLSELCFRRRGRSAHQSVSRGQDKNPDTSFIGPHLYKERKGGPARHPRGYCGTHELHFITCSCYHRQPWLASPQRGDLAVEQLPQLCLRRKGCGANQSVGRGKDENTGRMTSTFTKNVKVGQPPLADYARSGAPRSQPHAASVRFNRSWSVGRVERQNR
jgi:hypothetical protein